MKIPIYILNSRKKAKMAEEGYWAKMFQNAAPEAVAVAYLSQGYVRNEILTYCDETGPEKIASSMGGDWNRIKLGLTVVRGMKLVPEVIESTQSPRNIMSSPVYAGLQVLPQIKKSDPGAKKYLDEDPDHVIFYGPFSYILEDMLVLYVGKFLVESDWYKKNIKIIRREASKLNSVKKVMAQ